MQFSLLGQGSGTFAAAEVVVLIYYNKINAPVFLD